MEKQNEEKTKEYIEKIKDINKENFVYVDESGTAQIIK